VAGPPRGVRPVPGVRRRGVFLLPGVGPALAARRKGVLGCMRAIGVVAKLRSGDKRCFLRADSDMVGAGVVVKCVTCLLTAVGETRRWDAPSLTLG